MEQVVLDAINDLGDLRARPAAVAIIEAAGSSAVPALRDGLQHAHWRVRHLSARLLDDLPLDDETLAVLLEIARSDPHRKVRAQAYHAVGCDACKPDDAETCAFDKVGVLIDALADRSLRVRRRAATGLLHEVVLGSSTDPRVRTAVLASADDTDATIAHRAQLAATHLTADR